MNEYKYCSLLHLLFLLSVVVPVVNVVVIFSYIIFPVNIKRLSRDSCESETRIPVLSEFQCFSFPPSTPFFLCCASWHERPASFRQTAFHGSRSSEQEGTINTLCKEIKFKYPERNKSAARREQGADRVSGPQTAIKGADVQQIGRRASCSTNVISSSLVIISRSVGREIQIRLPEGRKKEEFLDLIQKVYPLLTWRMYLPQFAHAWLADPPKRPNRTRDRHHRIGTLKTFFPPFFSFFSCGCHCVYDFCPVVSPMVIYCIRIGRLWRCIVRRL